MERDSTLVCICVLMQTFVRNTHKNNHGLHVDEILSLVAITIITRGLFVNDIYDYNINSFASYP